MEEHAMEFLQFVADNEKRLKKNLRKNITYDENIFDDIFQTTILKVYDRIMKGEYIKDFEQYFFIASKFCYINEDNKNKKRRKIEDNEFIYNMSHGCGVDTASTEFNDYTDKMAVNDNEWELIEERNDKINSLFKEIAEILNNTFPNDEVDIFMIYYRLKVNKNGISYKKMAKITNKTVTEITNIIQRIKRFVRENDEINNIKKQMVDND